MECTTRVAVKSCKLYGNLTLCSALQRSDQCIGLSIATRLSLFQQQNAAEQLQSSKGKQAEA
eukprot:16342-Heterococcus_DN1.PRE.2